MEIPASIRDAFKRAKRFQQLMEPGEDRHEAFKRLAKAWHPDVGGDTEIMARISELYEMDEPKEVQIGKWIIREPLADGDVADLHWTTDGHVLKIAHDAADNDLMDAEKAALLELRKESHFGLYVPQLVDSFLASGRRVNVLKTTAEGLPLDEDDGALLIVADELPIAEALWRAQASEYVRHELPEPDRVYETSDEAAEEVFIFPDAGCC